jgi:hypothetical protein
MSRYWLPTTIGLSLALLSVGRADELTPTGFRKKESQPCPPACPPAPCLPGQPGQWMPGQPMPGQPMPGQPSVTPPGQLPPTGITPPTTPPRTIPPPTTTPPGAIPPPTTPSPISQAPSTESFAQAPAAGTTGSESFNPNMIGDMAAGSFICGFVPVTNYGVTAQRTFRGPTGEGFLQTVRILSNGTVQSNTIVPFQFTGTPTTTVTQFAESDFRKVLIPQAARGAYKIAENESPRPTDRFFLTYNYFNGVGTGIPGVPTFNLHREVAGFEKTYLDGDASIGLRVNSLQQTGDGALGADIFGNMTVINKFALINNYDTGNVASVGLCVTVPTGPDAILPDGSRMNPVILQPWTGGIWNRENFFMQGFSALAIATDDRDTLLAMTDLGVGYKLYQAQNLSESLITYIVPTSEVHVTVPWTKEGVLSQPVGFPTGLVVLTNGLHIGLGRATDLTVAVAVPITGPKTFNVEAVAQLNWRFGCSARRPQPTQPFIGN